MMDWSDRHCRFFHRLLTRRALLYTEMLTPGAVIHGDRGRLLGFDPAEHPVALQLGGSDATALAAAAAIGAAAGYDEVNINCGCPSDRVRSGRFGACLMAEPDHVARLYSAAAAAASVPVTVKCRIGIDDQDSEADLARFIDTVAAAGCRTFIVHARKAWLSGLSPKENREVPPLDYDRVYRLKHANPGLEIVINGGIASIEAARRHLDAVDGVMLGRAAYQNPWSLAEVDARVFGGSAPLAARADAIRAYRPYVAAGLDAGTALAALVKPVLGLFHGEPGGRIYRRVLSERGCRAGAGLDVLDDALAATERAPRRLAAA